MKTLGGNIVRKKKGSVVVAVRKKCTSVSFFGTINCDQVTYMYPFLFCSCTLAYIGTVCDDMYMYTHNLSDLK